MVQLENLGSPFHVNGPYALMVPDLLRRCSSVRMDRMGMMIGWHRGDTASFLAQSAGGQAVALLCFCLVNTCKQRDIGSVLNDLSDRILPISLAESSIGQLTTVADLLAARLQVIGFGNVLAKQVMRIQEAYHHIGKKLPAEFFDFMTSESIVELYHALSRLSSEESTVLQISGLHAMAHIVMIILIMFPDNAMITTESLIIQQGYSPSIFLDVNISDNENGPTMIRVEQRLDVSSTEPILVEGLPREHERSATAYHFKWACHITDALRIGIAGIGVAVSEALIEACCDLLLCLIQFPVQHKLGYTKTESPLSLDGYLGLLGSEPIQRCHHVCQVVFGATPRTDHCDVRSAYNHLVDSLNFVTGPAFRCTCSGVGACTPRDGWQSVLKNSQAKSVQSCLHRILWRSVVCALDRGYSAMLIDADPHATTTFDIAQLSEYSIRLPNFEDALKMDSLVQLQCTMFTCSLVHDWIMSDHSRARIRGGCTLAVSNGSSTIHPTSLNDLRINVDRGFRYNLYEGQLYVNGRRYNRLESIASKTRRKASKSLAETRGQVKPSCSGEHSRITFTIRETPEGSELRTTVIVQGHSIQLDLYQILCSSMGLNDAPECLHDPRTDLAPELQDDVWTTSVAAPKAKGKKIAIVQTKDNATAQLLACDVGSGLLLQRKSCLDCAILHAKANDLAQVIVAS